MITTRHRRLAAIALLTVGAVHLEQYTVAHYSAIPTIGSLFLANFVAATAFMEHGYRPEILISIAAETVAVVALGLVLAANRR